MHILLLFLSVPLTPFACSSEQTLVLFKNDAPLECEATNMMRKCGRKVVLQLERLKLYDSRHYQCSIGRVIEQARVTSTLTGECDLLNSHLAG